MSPAQYHDFQPETITEHRAEAHGLVRVISGELNIGDEVIQGPLSRTGVPVTVADWRAHSGASLNLMTPKHHNMMAYVYKGSIKAGERVVTQGEMALLSQGEGVALQANDTSGVLLFIGEPINEPVVHYGPFVMNSIDEIEQAIQDYNSGVFETY